jgi:type IV secretory pathway VirB4 component
MPIYTEYLPKPRWRAAHLSDKVPWRLPAAPGVMLHKQTHALQRTYAVRGPDLSSEVQEVQGALMLQANNVFKRLGGNWTIHAEAQRVRVTTYPESLWPHPVAALIDAERRRALVEDPGSFETCYFLTLTWQPPGATASLLDRLLVRRHAAPPGPTGDADRLRRPLTEFITQSDYLMYLLRGMLAMARPLTSDEMFTYLYACVNPTPHPVRCPFLPVDADVMLCTSNVLGGWEPQFGVHLDQPPHLVIPGRFHLRICSVTSFPPSSMAGMLQALDRREFPYRYCTRWVAYEQQVQDGLLETAQSHWLGQQKGLWTQVVEVLSKKPSEMIDNAARNQAADADAARQEVGADIIAFGDFTATIAVWDEDLARVEAKLQEVMQILDSRGFTAIREQEHATAAWLSSHPGNRVDSVRRTPQHSLTLAHLMPGLQAIWPGASWDGHLHQGPWFFAHTDGHTKFSVVNHVLDNGHFMVLGPTRSGKSVALAFQVAQWFRYPGAQAFPFDVDRSMRCLTLCLGGLHADLGAGTVRLQPLRFIDQPLERAWAGEWLRLLLLEQGVRDAPGLNAHLSAGLDTLATVPVQQRTLTELRYVLKAKQDRLERMPGKPTGDGSYRMTTRQEALLGLESEIQSALDLFVTGGRLGHVLDHGFDDLAASTERLITFEQRTLLTLPQLIGPALRAVFHRLEGRFDTRTPTLLPMDEFAVLAAVPDIAEQGKEWLMTRAKKNVSLGFATHSLVQIFGEADHTLGALMLEGCPTKFVLPNPEARKPQMAAVYRRLGFNDAEIQVISTARPQRDIYYSAELVGKRLYSLHLSPLLLAILARNTADDHELMDRMLAQEGREGFAPAWLRAQGFPEAASQIEEALSHAFQMAPTVDAAD